MRYLLNGLYLSGLLLAFPWLLWQAFRRGKYREGLAAKLLGRVPRRRTSRRRVWLHAVSLGEVNLAADMVAEIGRRWPQWECVLSTTTKTGYDQAQRRLPHACVFYAPLDFSWAVSRAIRRIRPRLLVLVELELWPNLIRQAHRSGVRVAVVNGRLGRRSYHGYRRLGLLFRTVAEEIDLIVAQNETYAARFRGLGVPASRVHVSGSMKFDGVATDRHNPLTARLRRLAGFRPRDIVFLAGSTQEPEEALALAAFRRHAGDYPHLRLVVVPRHPHRFEAVARLLDNAGPIWQRRSRLEQEGADPLARVLLVDSVGELSAWWGTASIAYVGGSMGQRGGQNMIEPAAYGAAVSFGPHTRNFRDVVATLLAQRAAVVVDDGDELAAFLGRCLGDPAFARDMGRRATETVVAQQGATDRTLALLAELGGESAQEEPRAAA